METSTQLLMQQVWMELNGPKNSCSIIHPHTSCPMEILIKFMTVVKKSSKLYAALYILMFVVQFKKIKHQKRIWKSILIWCKDYLFSLAFMSWLVGGMKTALCILNAIGSPLDGRVMPLLSLLGSTSIYFNDKSRRGEITYFVFVRACRSAYIYLKKRLNFPLKNQRQMSFIGIFAIISYLYFDCNPNLKNRNLLQNLWGEV